MGWLYSSTDHLPALMLDSEENLRDINAQRVQASKVATYYDKQSNLRASTGHTLLSIPLLQPRCP